MGDCNTNTTNGCADNSSYGDIKSVQPKLLDKFSDIESTLQSFSDALALYCESEEQNLTQISNRLSDVILINTDCCNTINAKLQQLLAVIQSIHICGEPTTTGIPTTTTEPTTTETPTTTVEPTTTIQPTTTIEVTTTVESTTTIAPTTTEFVPEFFARYFNEETKVSESQLLDTSGNSRNMTLTRRNCVLGNGTAKLTFSGLPTYDAMTIIEDGVQTSKTLTANELVLSNNKKYNYAVFTNASVEVAKFPLMEHDSDDTIDSPINFYDVIGSAACVLTSGSSANISKADGLSWNFEHGFAVVVGYNTLHPKMESIGGYGGITSETIIEYPPYSTDANQYVKAPAGDTDFITRDSGNQFYAAGVPFDVHLADIYDNSYITLTKDSTVINDFIIDLL